MRLREVGTFIVILVCCLPTGVSVAQTQHPSGHEKESQDNPHAQHVTSTRVSEHHFEPVTFRREMTIQLRTAPEKALPLFAPEWRRLYDSRWKPEVLYTPSGGGQEGKILRVATPFGDGHAILVFVNRYNLEKKEIRFSLLYQEVEIEKYRITCKASADGGTEATIGILIMGLNDFGNQAVTEYVDGGGLEEVAEEWGAAIDAHLSQKAP